MPLRRGALILAAVLAFLLVLIASRSPVPVNTFLTGFIGAVAGLLFGALVLRRFVPARLRPRELSNVRFLLALGLLMLLAAAAWENPPSLAGAAIVGVLLGLMLGESLPGPAGR